MFNEKQLKERHGEASAPADDFHLRSLFGGWIEGKRALNRMGIADDQAEKMCDAIDRIETSISELPAAGAEGVIIKSYLILHTHWSRLEPGGDAAAMGQVDPHEIGDPAFAVFHSLMRDAARLLPEMAAIAASKSPEAMRPEDIAEVRKRARALSNRASAPLPIGDAGLVEAERRLAELEAGESALYDDYEITDEIEEKHINPITEPVYSMLYEVITCTVPTTLRGAAIKLKNIANESLKSGEIYKPIIDLLMQMDQENARSGRSS